MTVSVVIPTLNRQEDLRIALASLAKNTRLPDEVIVVEQGDFDKTNKVIATFQQTFPIKLSKLSTRSLTAARNNGVAHSSGSIILFIDDDAELQYDYIDRLLCYLKEHSAVVGVVGKDLAHPRTYTPLKVLRTLLSCLFCGASFFGPSRVRRSGYNILQNFSDEEQTVEWLSGCAFAVRRSAFVGDMKFEESFIHWSLGEDVYFTYQLNKQHPHGLRYLPQLRFHHHTSPVSRLTKHEIIRMKIIYKYIFWKKEVFNGSFLNLVCYIWAQVGMTLMDIIAYRNFSALVIIVQSYGFVFKNYEKIDKEQIDYNNFILTQGR